MKLKLYVKVSTAKEENHNSFIKKEAEKGEPRLQNK